MLFEILINLILILIILILINEALIFTIIVIIVTRNNISCEYVISKFTQMQKCF